MFLLFITRLAVASSTLALPPLINFTLILGVVFYDVCIKGERILYEVSMQEATAHYGGIQPKAANTVYLLSLGSEIMGTLDEGYDCPWGSTFWKL